MKTKQDYEARLNQQFELAQAPLVLELIEVSSVQAERVEDGRSEPFSAVFRADNHDILEQGTYTLRNDGKGTDIFLVPIGPDDQGMCYEAIFT